MIRPNLMTLAFVGAALLAAPGPAAAQIFTTTLAGANEVPAADSPGTGNAIVTLDTIANTMRVQVFFSALTGNTTASHIHCCTAPGANVGVATVTPTFTGFPLGVTSGNYDVTYDMTLAGSFNAAFLNNGINLGNITTARTTLFNGISNGQAYVNVHTNLFPGGEIRGQLAAAVPEPASWGMMLIGFVGVGTAMRRRRRPARIAAIGA